MRKITILFIAGTLVTACAACTATPGDAGIRPRKVTDQRLAAYTTIRRLTYRDACGSEGPLTICVERITLSDGNALVETRISNASAQSYVLGNMQEASVLLADDAGMQLVWEKGERTEYQGLAERTAHFTMKGHLSGDPAIFMVNNIRKKNHDHADQGFPIVVKLGE